MQQQQVAQPGQVLVECGLCQQTYASPQSDNPGCDIGCPYCRCNLQPCRCNLLFSRRNLLPSNSHNQVKTMGMKSHCSDGSSVSECAPCSYPCAEVDAQLLALAKTGWLVKPSGGTRFSKARYQQHYFRIVEEQEGPKLAYAGGPEMKKEKKISLRECVNCVSVPRPEGWSVLLEFRAPVKISHSIQDTILELHTYSAADAEAWAEAIRRVSSARAEHPDPVDVSRVQQQIKHKKNDQDIYKQTLHTRYPPGRSHVFCSIAAFLFP